MNDVVSLVTDVTVVKNGFKSKGELSRREVFASVDSVFTSEFYQAKAQGILLDAIVMLHKAEYNNEKQLEYNKKLFDVVKSYDKGDFTYLSIKKVGEE